MSGLTHQIVSSRRVRWAAPAVAAVVLIGAGPAISAITANAQGSLPPRTAAQLLTDVQRANVSSFSGTIVLTSAFGLPELPAIDNHGGSNFSSLVSGSHTMRVWYAGPHKVRAALLGQLGESDLVRNGNDVWAWSSDNNSATHWTVPASSPDASLTPAAPSRGEVTPQQAAASVLKAINPTTRVTTDPTAMVAGRRAYELNVVPRDHRSLIGSVRIAIDGATHIPTRVQVYARGAHTPSFEIGFTSFSTAMPPDSTFAFQPPPGATVKTGKVPMMRPQATRQHEHLNKSDLPTVVGKGWTSVVVAHVGKPDAAPGSTAATQHTMPSGGPFAMLQSLPQVSGAWGSGHLLRTSLFSAVLTDDGRVALGAVEPAMLYHALSR
jgi:outer membrane lipoprotein-sorting protein